MGAVLRAGRIFTLCGLRYFDILPACRRLRPGLALSALRSKCGEVFADDALLCLFADHRRQGTASRLQRQDRLEAAYRAKTSTDARQAEF
jgi:hypothetical protein